MWGTVILTNFEFSSTIFGKVSNLSGRFSGVNRVTWFLDPIRGRSHMTSSP